LKPLKQNVARCGSFAAALQQLCSSFAAAWQEEIFCSAQWSSTPLQVATDSDYLRTKNLNDIGFPSCWQTRELP
jgi:hypothetical protein